MDIGLLDCEAILYPRSFFPNLDIMKLAAYHKKKRDYTTLILDIEKMTRFDTIYFRKEKNDGRYPPGLLVDPRCKYGGSSFTGGKYISLGKEVEDVIPDISIYDKFFKYKMDYGLEKTVDSWRRSHFMRFSTNGVDYDLPLNMYNDGMRRGRNYVYDKNLLDLTDVIEDLQDTGQKFICMYEQESDDIEKILEWTEAKVLHSSTKILCTKSFEPKDYLLYSGRAKETSNRILIPTWTNEDAVNKLDMKYIATELEKALNYAIYSYTNQSKIYPYCRYIPIHSNISNVIRVFNTWTTGFMGAYSYYESVCRNRGKKTLDELCALNKELDKLTKIEPKAILEKGGVWVL